MKILVVTKNNILGNGLAAELELMGCSAKASSEFAAGFDLYLRDADTVKTPLPSREITFSKSGGADLQRPFSRDELSEFIKYSENKTQEDSADMEFDASELSSTEKKLLEVLLENRGNPVSAQELSRRVWGRESIKSNIVNVYIRYLREKLEKDSSRRVIFTIRGKGYKID